MGLTVLIADDQELVRTGFAMVIDSDPEIEVVGEASDGLIAVSEAKRLRPDVILMDIRMPGIDGIEATRRVLESATADWAPRVLILTTFDLDEHVHAALEAGASGFLLKDVSVSAVADAIRVVAAGDALLAPSVTKRLLDEFTRQSAPKQLPEGWSELTDREREVFDLVANGLTNEEIAAKLFLAKPTVKTHVSRLLAKLEARDRVQLVVIAHQSGLPAADERPH